MEDQLRVVLIDDDSGQAEILAMIFRRQRPAWQVSVEVVDEARSEILAADPRAVCGSQVDLVVVDYRLGDRVVVGILPGLRELAPVVVLTGSIAGCDVEACCKAGADSVVAKPYTLNEATAALAACDRALEPAT